MKQHLRRLLWLPIVAIFGIFSATLSRRVWRRACVAAHKNEAISIVRPYVPVLIAGLSRSQSAISMDEHDAIMHLAKNNRVASLLYLNKYGEVRWFRDPSRITYGYEQFVREVTLPTDAIEQATLAKLPVARTVAGLPLYDVAIPLVQKGEVLGVLDLQIASLGMAQIIREACTRMPPL